MRDFAYEDAPSTERAVELLGTVPGQAKLIAGGTDLLDALKEGIIAPARLVNLKANTALRYIRFDASTGLHLGALATLAELESHADMRTRYPVLLEAVSSIASPQIRNVATVAGNLCQRPRCWYYRNEALLCLRKGGPICYAVAGDNTYHAILGGYDCYIVHPSDLAPALMALDAQVTIAGPRGRRTLPLKEFYSEYLRLYKEATTFSSQLGLLRKFPLREIPGAISKGLRFYSRLKTTHLDYAS